MSVWIVMSCVFCQLINTKTQDGKQTLMHFLVDCVEKRFPEVMDFASEMIHVEKAARGLCICRVILLCLPACYWCQRANVRKYILQQASDDSS